MTAYVVAVDDDRPGCRVLVLVDSSDVPIPPRYLWDERPARAAAVAWERHAGSDMSSLGHVFRVTEPDGYVTRWVHEPAGWLLLGCHNQRPGCDIEEAHVHQRGGGLACPWCGHELGDCLTYGCGEAAREAAL